MELSSLVGVLRDWDKREAKLRKLAWIALALLLTTFPAMAQQSAPSEEVTPPEEKSSSQPVDLNDLKGDKLGETLDVFTSNHPKLKCMQRNSLLSDCHVWEDVSIAGITVRGVEKCGSETSGTSPELNCLQGIDAHFVNKLLAGVSYLVEGDSNSKDKIVSSLRQEFGSPSSEGNDQTTWANNILILSVTLLKPNPKSTYVEVTLDLKESEVGEDI